MAEEEPGEGEATVPVRRGDGGGSWEGAMAEVDDRSPAEKNEEAGQERATSSESVSDELRWRWG